MARHNREGHGEDQRGHDYEVSYQPDWLHLVKVTRQLENGRQSTKTLFKNEAQQEQKPGTRVRTAIASEEQDLEFEITVNDPKRVVRRIIVETGPATTNGRSRRGDALGEEDVVFTIEDRLTP